MPSSQLPTPDWARVPLSFRGLDLHYGSIDGIRATATRWEKTMNTSAPAPYTSSISPGLVSFKTNTLAILSFVFALLLCCPLAVLFGHIALHQIRSGQERGRGLALTGLIIGYVIIGFSILVLVAAASHPSTGN